MLDLLHLYPYRLVRELADPEARVLEVGFGEGYGADLLRDSVSAYSGLEVSAAAVRHAVTQYGDARLSFFHYDGRRFPFPDASFDMVISFHVIEHVHDTGIFLSEIRRTCGPGGTIIIDTPNRNYRLAPGERPWNRHHRLEFDPQNFRLLLEEYFEHVELFGIIGTPLVNSIERARAARLRRLAKLDPLGIRHLLPASLTHLAGRWAAKVSRAPGSKRLQVEPSGLSWSDIRHTEEDLDDSLVLLAVISNPDVN